MESRTTCCFDWTSCFVRLQSQMLSERNMFAMGLFKNSHFLSVCDKLIHQPGFILGWGYVALRNLFESHSISRIESLTFVPAAVGSLGNPISEEGSTVYEICYHCCVSQFHLASIPSVSATHTKKVHAHTHTHKLNSTAKKKPFLF